MTKLLACHGSFSSVGRATLVHMGTVPSRQFTGLLMAIRTHTETTDEYQGSWSRPTMSLQPGEATSGFQPPLRTERWVCWVSWLTSSPLPCHWKRQVKRAGAQAEQGQPAQTWAALPSNQKWEGPRDSSPQGFGQRISLIGKAWLFSLNTAHISTTGLSWRELLLMQPPDTKNCSGRGC